MTNQGRKDAKLIVSSIPETKLLEILTDFYKRQSQDIMIGFFFEGKNLEEIARKQMLFIKLLSGEKIKESVTKPGSAHLSLPPILTGHFDRRHVLLKETLKAHQVPEQVIQSWLHMEESFRAAITDSRR